MSSRRSGTSDVARFTKPISTPRQSFAPEARVGLDLGASSNVIVTRTFLSIAGTRHRDSPRRHQNE
jgi:hypothetical protein